VNSNDQRYWPALGYENDPQHPVRISPQARRLGMYVIGTPGTGKTTLLQNMIVYDMRMGDGLCVLDPHGDMVDDLLLRVPDDRVDDVIWFAPADREQWQRPLGLNLFDCNRDDPQERNRVSSTIVSTFYKLFYYSWGPRMEDLLRHATLALLETEETTLLELWLMMLKEEGEQLREEIIQRITDSQVEAYWTRQFPMYKGKDYTDVVSPVLNKVGRFLANSVIRNVVAQQHSAFSMREAMDEGKIVLCNLSKGELGEDNSSLFGSVLVNLILMAGMQRRDVSYDQRRQFHLTVDEFQNFATESFATLQSEARKYGVDVVVAHQFRDQLDDLNKGSTLNVANFMVFRVTGKDGMELSLQFNRTPPPGEFKGKPIYYGDGEVYSPYKPPYGDIGVFVEGEHPRRTYNDVAGEIANDLSTLPDYVAQCRLTTDNGLKYHTIRTYKQPSLRDEQVAHEKAQYIRDRTLREYGVPVEDVVADIRQRSGLSFDDRGTFPTVEPVD